MFTIRECGKTCRAKPECEIKNSVLKDERKCHECITSCLCKSRANCTSCKSISSYMILAFTTLLGLSAAKIMHWIC